MISHLTWSNFRTGIIRPGEDRSHRVSSDPETVVFADQSGKRIGILLERRSAEPMDSRLCRLLVLNVEELKVSGKNMLRVTCSRSSIFREAYLFFTGVIDRIVQDGEEAAAAVEDELSALESILNTAGVLSIEKQIGLFGELLVLGQFIQAGGAALVSAWTGPMGEAHDFRIAGREFEVKTTTARRRIHTINGFTQAVPSPDSDLFFLSILLAAAGAGEGESLPSLVMSIEASLSADRDALSAFRTSLENCGYRSEDAPAYGRSWKIRAPLMVVPVDGRFPRLDQERLILAMGSSFGRLEDIQYEVNLDNAGSLLDDGLTDYLSGILQVS
jgi:hypothetical protein